MSGYAAMVMILSFAVELLLLLGADRLYGHPAYLSRVFLGAGIGGLYAGLCLLPRFFSLNSFFCRLFVLVLVALIAFGASVSAVRRGAVFLLLNLALDGIASDFSRESLWCLAVGSAVLAIMCLVGFRSRGSQAYVPVEIIHAGKHLRMTALRDTGNTLLDPVTGRSVLIVGADAAYDLVGLTRQQLQTPLEAMVSAGVPGLRLIPYHTVGQSTGFMLGLRMQDIKVGNKKGSCLVVFAPEGLNRQGTYQALTGGVI